MFWTIVGAILFVTVVIPILLWMFLFLLAGIVSFFD